MKKVLVTGARGFIGRHCLPALAARGFEVHAVSSIAEEAAGLSSAVWHRADLLNPSQAGSLVAAVQPTHLLHLAWHYVPGGWSASGDHQHLQWVQASLELLRRFDECGGRRAVIAGTCAEYDWSFGFCSESCTPTMPRTLYGTCKNSLRLILEKYFEEQPNRLAWARVFFLFGPHEQPGRLVSTVIRSLLQGEVARCTAGLQFRDYLYVQDVADALVTLLDSDVTGAVNIGSGRPTAIKDLAAKIAAKLGREDLLDLGALPTPEKTPPFLVADVSRLSREVGWTPRFGIDDGLDATIDWTRERLLIASACERKKQYVHVSPLGTE